MRKKQKKVQPVQPSKPKFSVNSETLEMLPFVRPLSGDTIKINLNKVDDCPENVIILADGYLTAEPCFYSCIVYWEYGIWYTYQIKKTDEPNVGVLVLVQKALPGKNPDKEGLSMINHKHKSNHSQA